ncbi:hypothetical protein ACFP8W_04460 [Nocardioides hankookensis]
MHALYRWVVELQDRFPEMVRLPKCWHRHNGLVEVLQALHDYERASFAPTSPPTGAANWHMTFRDLESRLRTWVSALGCGGSASASDRGAECHQVTPLVVEIPVDVMVWIRESEGARQ